MFNLTKTHFVAWLFISLYLNCYGQEPDTNAEQAQEAHTIILSPGRTKPLAFLYAASARAEVRAGLKEIEQTIQLQLRIVQGDSHQAETVSLGLGGSGEVIEPMPTPPPRLPRLVGAARPRR